MADKRLDQLPIASAGAIDAAADAIAIHLVASVSTRQVTPAALMTSAGVLLANGSVAATSDMDLAGNAIANEAPKGVRTEAGAFSVDGDDHDVPIRYTGTGSVAATFNTGTIGQYGTIHLTGVAGSLTLTAGTASLLIEEGSTAVTLAPTAGGAVSVSYVYLTASLVHVVGGLVAA